MAGLDAIRSQQLAFRLPANPRGIDSLRFYAVTWEAVTGAFARQLQPMNWHLPDHTAAMPALQLQHASEYWQSQLEGDAVTLPVRRGAFGLWWQFDANAVREKWKAYYAAHP